MVVAAASGGFGQVFVGRAYARAQASRLAAFGYMGIVFTYLLEVILFARTPAWNQVAGSLMVIAAGVGVSLAKKPAMPPVPTARTSFPRAAPRAAGVEPEALHPPTRRRGGRGRVLPSPPQPGAERAGGSATNNRACPLNSSSLAHRYSGTRIGTAIRKLPMMLLGTPPKLRGGRNW